MRSATRWAFTLLLAVLALGNLGHADMTMEQIDANAFRFMHQGCTVTIRATPDGLRVVGINGPDNYNLPTIKPIGGYGASIAFCGTPSQSMAKTANDLALLYPARGESAASTVGGGKSRQTKSSR